MGFDPAGRLFKKQVADKHQDAVNAAHDDEHVGRIVVASGNDGLHDWSCDCFCRSKTRDGQACGQALAVLEPKHQGLYRRKVSGAQADSHDDAVANQNARERFGQNAEAGSHHSRGEENRGDERTFVNVLFDKVAQKGGRHSQEENRQRERPFDRAFGAADVGGDFLAKNRPAVNCAD